jgi:signal transduction histidine kinase
MSRGDLSARAGLGRDDELGMLGLAFDTMAAEVESTRKNLQHTVAIRTRQLEEAQESLVRREKLATIGQLSSGVAHELRNPLGVINNAVFYLDAVQADATPQVREYHEIIHRQVSLATKIVNDLLDFARKPPANLKSVSLDQVVLPQLRDIPLDGVRVEQDLPPTLPPVIVDPVHAGQVVYNLVTNAVQAMGDAGGILRVRGRSDGNGCVCLEISDTGPGIPPENLERIFEPLFTTKTRGIGLGLSVSRTLAQGSGGDLTVFNNPDRGATFVFSLRTAADE